MTADQRYFEDIDPGDEFEESWEALPEHVQQYVTLGQRNLETMGRFRDAAGAREVGLQRPIVPGMMSLAVLTRLVTDWMGPQGRLQTMDVDFRRPVQQGDTLRVLGLITDTHEDDGRPIVKLDVYLENDRGERPLQGVAIVELPRRP
ncbi:MAG: hypothetical protein FJ035_03700 [Chloroflexi bacterium]|nr:hypothetical protein [Chloroflexota bacterium]